MEEEKGGVYWMTRKKNCQKGHDAFNIHTILHLRHISPTWHIPPVGIKQAAPS